MKFTGNIRKMKSEAAEVVQYALPLFEILEPNHLIPLNELIGKPIRLTYENAIHCVLTGKKIKKAFGEGMSYEAFMNSPQASPSIINPELSRIHEGIALRDYDWEMANHMQPHYVYLSLTSGLKVGVTRTTQVPTRWIDQGATQAIVLSETPYRQAAGLIEVALKAHLNDKTNWQQMLKGDAAETEMGVFKEQYSKFIPDELKQYSLAENIEAKLKYPVLQYPEKVSSLKFDNLPEIEGVLTGIKGQYLMLDNKKVLNIRSHAGYRISLEY